MVKGILCDVNIQGNFEYLVKLLVGESWRGFWDDLHMVAMQFADVGLAADASDHDVWHFSQTQELVLLTGNRNARGPDSLQETIRRHNSATSLPVLTLADPPRVLDSREYADRVVERLLDYLERMDSLRGTGRLFLP